MWRGWRGEPPALRYSRPQGRPVPLLPSDVPQRLSRSRRQGWRTDYPGADINFSIRFAELTKTAVSIDGEGDPEYFVVRSSGDDNLFHCPFVHIEDAGTAQFTDEDVASSGTYLLKGGFMWSDDFWGSRAWTVWEHEIGAGAAARTLSDRRHPRDARDVPDGLQRQAHPAGAGDQPLAVQRRRDVRARTTTAPWSTPAASSTRRAGLMVLMTHNTDISDTWEREGEDIDVLLPFSPEGYAHRHQRDALRDDALDH